jgi:hypothetical protein
VIRWIAFDNQAAAALDSRWAPVSAEVQSGDPLAVALSLSTPSVVVLPSSTAGKVVLAYVQTRPRKVAPPAAHLTFEPSGFLGLSDNPVFVDETPPPLPKRQWWQRKKAA